MAFKAYVTSNELPRSALRILKSVAQVKQHTEDGPPQRNMLQEEVTDVDGLLCLLTDRIDAPIIKRAKRLRVISNIAVGYDNIDIDEATKKGIIVTNTPGVLTETVADLTVGLMLAIARRLPEADRYVREGKWKVRWSPMMMVGSDIHSKTLGIYGLGRIGMAVAKRVRGFDMKIIYFDSVRNKQAETEGGLSFVGLDELLTMSDFVTLHVPLTPETRHSIGRREFALMKNGAFLINTSRGPVVDERALYAALAKGKIAGAALDVFEKEPIGPGNPLAHLANVILLPHIGSASIETRTAMANLAASNMATALKGKIPPNVVNKAVVARLGSRIQ